MSTSFRFEPRASDASSSVLPEAQQAGVSNIIDQGPTKRVGEELTTGHPLESRLASWENTQLNTKLHMQRQVYGLHAPMRTMMEVKAVQQTPSVLGSRAAQIQRDILLGKDESLDIGDVFNDTSEVEINVHSMLASRLNV
ncbi:hypothetical protein IWW55_000188 [Coemansia sp. RSA 2706]|nr:hypothetical protein LPJ70_007417 [Coemansia sp. RSA 2708]KAJ1832815.1 hypothetical protein LPJ63_003246 [Coemansia sp. RSA 2711]KAJ2308844.1 hypothetical protein IWW55_000188 [Coemansia sp. RSA 2706]KAJ2315563.1 hypothetical protein IWW54_000194 [Coemansia sp. RSA 2705]KAJ2322268.1 hypothetical protein IWW52_000194 [Coemansia sp. RSA 2704]KAJ2330028.1 hypothetical protein IWW51_000224 [Coemansia sp. RSA 2702]KAJ2370189.1 hypothetical protein H4S01_000534 [Coemansia sp. RSA 2610]KAJ238858